MQDIGADETIDYRSQDFAEVYKDKPFDYIFDSVGGMPATPEFHIQHYDSASMPAVAFSSQAGYSQKRCSGCAAIGHDRL